MGPISNYEPRQRGFPAKLILFEPTFTAVESHAWGGEMISNVIDYVTKTRERHVRGSETDVSKASRSGRVNSTEIRELFADVFEDQGRSYFAAVR